MYLQEFDYNIGAENDPELFLQAISCKESDLWFNAMKDEISSMASNKVLDLVKLPNNATLNFFKFNVSKRNHLKVDKFIIPIMV